MRRNILFGLGIVVVMLAIYSRPPSVIAAPAKDPCPCEQAFLAPNLATLIVEGIVQSGERATSCQDIHLTGGTLGVSVNLSNSTVPLSAEARKNSNGSLQCTISIPGIGENTSQVFSMGQYNSCKRSIRQLCGDLADLGFLQ